VFDPGQPHVPRRIRSLLAAAGVVQIGEDDDELAHGRYRTAIVQFTLESAPGGNRIRGYSPTEIRIGEQRVHVSCIVTASELLTEWGPATFAEFTSAHLPALTALEPEVVLLGTGMRQQFAPAEIRNALAARGIGLEAMQLGAACRTFNVLVQEERRVAAALFLS